jgi:nickel/cobalt transporter (NiCoT) family protein
MVVMPHTAAPFYLRVGLLLGILAVANIGVWILALRMTGAYPVLIGSALLAYGLGLRHAFDADHIAAIDNVTRRLVAAGGRPVGVGFFFSLGHSTVVVFASVGVALLAGRFRAEFGIIQDVLGPIGTAFSSIFLLFVGALNILVFAGLWRALRRQSADPESPAAAEMPAAIAGPFSRILGGAIHRVGRSWLMYPLGFVFALGFDTATEVGLLGLAAAQAAKGLPLWSILIFPALFAAGMALADTLEALFMLGAYRWTSTRPRSRLYYDVTATAASILVAATVAFAQLAGLAPRLLSACPLLEAAVALFARQSEWIGLLVVVIFAILWSGWAFVDRAYTRLPPRP